MTFTVNHEWSDDGDCAVGVTADPPCWKFSLWDIAGIAFGTVGGILISIGTGLGYVNRECQAAAEYSRQRFAAEEERWEQDVARAEMAGTLEGLVMFSEGDAP